MRMTSSRPFYPLLVVLVLAGFPALGSTQSKVWMGKEKDYERFLTNAEIVSVKDVGSGVNQPKRITLRQGARELDALWKSIQRGPKEWAWESFEAEVAAYQLDRILGLHMVPPTVVRSIQGQEGSLQLFNRASTSFSADNHVLCSHDTSSPAWAAVTAAASASVVRLAKSTFFMVALIQKLEKNTSAFGCSSSNRSTQSSKSFLLSSKT